MQKLLSAFQLSRALWYYAVVLSGAYSWRNMAEFSGTIHFLCIFLWNITILANLWWLVKVCIECSL